VLKRISGNTFDHDVVAFRALKRTRFKARAIRRDAREHRAIAAAFANRTLYGCRSHDAPLPQNIAGLEQASQPTGIVSGLLLPNALTTFALIQAKRLASSGVEDALSQAGEGTAGVAA